MARPRKIDLAKLAVALSAADLQALVKVVALKARRDSLVAAVTDLDKQIAALTDKSPAKRRGRKPGRRGRPAKVRRMRKGKRATTKAGSGKAKRKRTPKEQAAINARMAKARAARKTATTTK